jgi:hypothetical protein
LPQKVSRRIGVATPGKKHENKEERDEYLAGMGKMTTEWACHIGTAIGPQVRNLIN